MIHVSHYILYIQYTWYCFFQINFIIVNMWNTLKVKNTNSCNLLYMRFIFTILCCGSSNCYVNTQFLDTILFITQTHDALTITKILNIYRSAFYCIGTFHKISLLCFPSSKPTKETHTKFKPTDIKSIVIWSNNKLMNFNKKGNNRWF